MKERITQKMGQPYPLGVTSIDGGVNIAVSLIGKKQCGIVLYQSGNEVLRIGFEQEFRVGNLYTICLEGIDIVQYEYTFFSDEKIVDDPYAKQVIGKETWGIPLEKGKSCRFRIPENDFSWGNDRPLHTPYHEMVLYQLHVRGFTSHPSSQVEGKGTFRGIWEKIPYFKKLGITAIECMPVYEFEEVITNKSYQEPDREVLPFLNADKKEWEYRINYWGFAKAFYFSPKTSFSYSGDSNREFKELVKKLHENGLEIILQMFFTKETRPGFVLEVLKYWVQEYHVDGFHLLGTVLPMELIETEPMLGRTKVMSEQISGESENYDFKPRDVEKNLAVYRDDFLYDARRFLKSDGDMLNAMARHVRNNPQRAAVINYITNYQGFTLMDLVSYDKKHNEKNGEDNRDGNDYNYSWNCGVEGKTRKKNICQLRLKQIKNAFAILLLSQGTPMIVSGDEFGNSAEGNNNPYCQDNAITWLNWKQTSMGLEIYEFVRRLIEIRREHPILHCPDELKIMDYLSCGYPDISYHGEQAWYPQFQNYNRHFAVMFCGKYARINKVKEDDFFYVVFNAHWVEHDFGLPKLPAGKKWHLFLNTADQGDFSREDLVPLAIQSKVSVMPRTTILLIGK